MHNYALIQNIFSGGGGMGFQRQTRGVRGGPTNFTIAKTRILENRGEGTFCYDLEGEPGGNRVFVRGRNVFIQLQLQL